MGYTHSVLLVLSGLSCAPLFFISLPPLGEPVRIGLSLMAPVLLGSILLHRNPRIQIRLLTIIQITFVVLSIFHYYVLLSTGELMNFDGGTLTWTVLAFSPVLGYVFLSSSIRVLARNLKILDQADRLRD